MKLMTIPPAVFLLSLLFSSTVFAKTINLYDQPTSDAKIIGTIDSEKGLIPIFTPKDGLWVKVADPQNGNVAWAKPADLKVDGTSNQTTTQTTQGSGPQRFIGRFGERKPLTDAQMKEYTDKMRERQQAIQEHMQHMMQDMHTQFNEISTHFPAVMPVQQNKSAPSSTPETKVTAPSDQK